MDSTRSIFDSSPIPQEQAVEPSYVAPDVNIAPEDRWCITCKWCGTNASRNADTYKCFAPQNIYTVSLVDGNRVYNTPLCKEHRVAPTVNVNTCGIAGSWWKQKPAAPSQQLASMGDEFELPPVDKAALAAKLAAARKPRVKVATNLLQDLGL